MSTTYTIARLYPSKNVQEKPKFPKNLNQLEIGGKIQFFRNILQAQMDLKSNDNGWWLVFFKNETYERIFYVDFQKIEIIDNELVESKPKRPDQGYDWPVDTLACVTVDKNSLDLDSICKSASKLIHNSNVIRYDDLYQAPDHYEHISGKGTIYLSRGREHDQFYRHVLLHALAQSYLLTMEQLSNELAGMLVNKQSSIDLRELYKTMAEFNAKNFFHQPVKIGKASTCEAWSRLDKVLGITESNRELSKQLDQVHYIFTLDTEKHMQEVRENRALIEKRKDKRLEIFLMMISILIALISIPGLVNLF